MSRLRITMIGSTISHYRIRAKLGEGGMGVVYEAEDTKLGRVVALKFLSTASTRDPLARTRFLQEARAAAQLDHVNICTVHEIGEDENGRTFIAMAYYPGGTLRQRFAKGPLPLREALDIARQVLRGLRKAHRSAIVHRDVKPGNIALTEDGVAKLLDFGLAKLGGATGITGSKAMLGTAAYMAPEQVKGEAVGSATDLWSVGVMLYEMISGQLPFPGDLQSMSYAIVNESPRPLNEAHPDVPVQVQRLVSRLLRKDPMQRYASADEVLADLDPIIESRSGGGSADRGYPEERETFRPGARLGPYEIARALGSGGMGDVYLARDHRLERDVAVKVLPIEFSEDAERRARFRQEAKTIASVSHPNICAVLDVGEQDGVDFLVMEYLEGETLAARLKRGPVPIKRTMEIGAAIAEGLGHAHRNGVIHRDLKPANVMLLEAGGVKLLDFGLAKGIESVFQPERTGSGDEEETAVYSAPVSPGRALTAEGTIVGTLPYMAPEQVEGRQADERSDIFALGAIVWEMIAGTRAFQGESDAALVAAILSATTPALSSLDDRTPPALDHLVSRCLEKNPDDRWQSASDVGLELRWILDGRSQAGDVRKADRRPRWQVAVALGIVAAVVAMLGWSLSRSPTPSAERSVFEIWPPEGTRFDEVLFSGWDTYWPLSPDGRHVGMVIADDDDATSQLMVRSLDGPEFRAVNGTEQLEHWCWSPDGEWLAFVKSRALYKTAIAGGSIIKLADLKRFVRGRMSWGRDGKIYLGKGTIHAVPEDGGDDVSVTSLEPGEMEHFNVFSLPDGKILFQVEPVQGASTEGVYISTPGSERKTFLAKAEWWGWSYVAGYLVIRDTSNLKRLHFHLLDAEREAVREESVSVDLPFDIWGCPSISESGVIAASGWHTEFRPELVWFDRHGKRMGSFDEPMSGFQEPRISPDALRVAVFARGSDPLTEGLYIYDLQSGSRTRIVDAGGNLPQWTPDGRAVYYKFEGDHPQIRRARADGVGEPEVLIDSAHHMPNDVAADGRVLFHVENDDGPGAFRLLEPDGTGSARSIPAPAGFAALSPDATLIAYGDTSGNVFVQPLDASAPRVQVPGKVWAPRWTRESNELFCLTNKDELVVTKVTRGPNGIEIARPEVLFKAPIRCWNICYDVTADGQRVVAVVKETGPREPINVLLNWAPGLFGSK